MLALGQIYVINKKQPQPNWPTEFVTLSDT